LTTKCPQCLSDNPQSSRFCADCGTRLNSDQIELEDQTKTIKFSTEDFKRGNIFAERYEVIELLGKGGMGLVYRVEDKKTREEVALKILKAEIIEDKETVERFSNELKLARKIAHRNVCKMYHLAEIEGIHYLTMEYIPGEDLKSLIRMSGQMGIGTAVNIARQIGEGLAEAHRQVVIHRDLKPKNIMVDKKGTARIMDFGIAHSFEAEDFTKGGYAEGTPEYMSPEQVEGKKLDQRTDIYSLGLIIYEMVTGRVPFKGDTPYIVGMKQKNELPASPLEFNAQVPKSLASMILKCLEKDREKRYSNVEELLRDLKEIEKEVPQSKRIPLRISGASRKNLRLFSVPGVLILTALILISGYIIYDQFLKPKPSEPATSQIVPLDDKSIVVLPFDDISPEEDNSYFSEGLTDEIITDLSKLNSIRVISRTSAMILKSLKKDIKSIGKELNVQYVLEGSVRKMEKDIRINVQLIDSTTETQVWADKFSGTIMNVFEIQENLSRAIVDALKIKLTQEESARIAQRPINDVFAYEYYLRARQEIWSWDAEALERALQYLERGLEIVGENILLYAGIGYVNWQYYNAGIKLDEKYLQTVRDYADKIFALEPDSSYGHLLLGLYYTMGNNQESVRCLKRVLEKDPNNVDALFWLTAVYSHVGKIQAALPLVEKLLTIDPFNPINHSLPGWLYFFNGQFDLAVDPFLKMYEMMPENPANRGLYAAILIFNFRFEEAFSLIDQLAKDEPTHLFTQIGLFLKYGLQGDKAEAKQMVTEELQLVAGRDITYSWFIAVGYAIIGEKEKALDWLENAVNWGFINYPFLSEYDPFLDNIRNEARFKLLMEKVKIEWENFEL
jgi:serine/threonine protein kinase/Flp pilus assembly protein TadD